MQIKRKLNLIFFVVFTLMFTQMSVNNVFSSNIITKEALVKRIQQFFKKTKTMQGQFTLIRNGMVETGIFFQKSPNLFKMIFGAWNGSFKIENKTLLYDGKQLWFYLPSIKVVIDQDVSRASDNIAYSGSGFGIRRLIRKYKYEFLDNDNSLKTITGLKSKVRILKLYESKSFSQFNEILLYVREDGFISKTRAITKKNKVIEIIRTNVKLNVDIDNKHFIFRVPKDAQIIRNPLVSGG